VSHHADCPLFATFFGPDNVRGEATSPPYVQKNKADTYRVAKTEEKSGHSSNCENQTKKMASNNTPNLYQMKNS
jgi:hypothetical protein